MASDPGRRRLLHGAAAAGVAWTLGAPALAQVSDASRAAMAKAAAIWLAALPPDAQRRAMFAFSDAQRQDWHYVPRRREGVAHQEMPVPARTAMNELMHTSLSGVGYTKAVAVMKLEVELRRIETFGGLLRDPDNYNDANHIHSVWHDPRNDFGADLLRAHYQHGHQHRHA